MPERKGPLTFYFWHPGNVVGPFRLPDLAIEVVSRNDLASELDEKVEDYQKAGVGLVWVIHPESRTATVYRSDGSVSRLHQDDELSGEEVIPGFRCQLRSLFPGSGAISEAVS